MDGCSNREVRGLLGGAAQPVRSAARRVTGGAPPPWRLAGRQPATRAIPTRPPGRHGAALHRSRAWARLHRPGPRRSARGPPSGHPRPPGPRPMRRGGAEHATGRLAQGPAHPARRRVPGQGELQPLRPVRHVLRGPRQGRVRLPRRRCARGRTALQAVFTSPRSVLREGSSTVAGMSKIEQLEKEVHGRSRYVIINVPRREILTCRTLASRLISSPSLPCNPMIRTFYMPTLSMPVLLLVLLLAWLPVTINALWELM